MSNNKCTKNSNDHFKGNDQGNSENDKQVIFNNKVQVEQHADGHKKETGEGIFERNDVTKSIVTILRFRDH